MRFSYQASASDGSWEVNTLPNIPATFINPQNGREITVFPLVDSGAAFTVINRQVAEALGIDIASGARLECFGMGGTFYACEHRLLVKIIGSKDTIPLICGVTRDLETDSVLGQEGFFDHYKVIFEKYNNTFEIILRRRF